jgi:endonuclease YncB( thermonuclease family)
MKEPKMKYCLFAILVAIAGPCAAESITGVASVIDGDTIEVRGLRIRLEAIDALESGQTCTLPSGKLWRCARDAAFALSDKAGHTPVSCTVSGADRYGRYLATCFSGDIDLNGWMVRNGWAVAYRKYGTQYARQEAKARAEGLGIWASEFAMPWDWRHSKSGN